MIISSQPVRFMMKPAVEAGDTLASPDAVDFRAMFSNQEPDNLHTHCAPDECHFSVILQCHGSRAVVIDVMDTGKGIITGRKPVCGLWIISAVG